MIRKLRPYFYHTQMTFFTALLFSILFSQTTFAQSECTLHLEMVELDPLKPSPLFSSSFFLDNLNNDVTLSPNSRVRILQRWDKDQVWRELIQNEIDISSKRLLSTQQILKYELQDIDVLIPELGLVFNSERPSALHENVEFQLIMSEHLRKHMTEMLYKQIEFLSFFKVKQSEVKWVKFFLVQTMAYPFISIYNDENFQAYKNLMAILDGFILNLKSQSRVNNKSDFELNLFFGDTEMTQTLRDFVMLENDNGRSFLSLDDLNPRSWAVY